MQQERKATPLSAAEAFDKFKEEIKESQEVQEFKNVPITRQQLEKLPMKKEERQIGVDKEGKPVMGMVPVPVYTNNFPNNRQRRMHKQPLHRKGGNRKNTKGRHRQEAEVMSKIETKFGLLNQPTGLKRRIIHTPVEVKINKFKSAVIDKIFHKKEMPATKEEKKAA